MKITNHGDKRLKERCGFNKNARDRMANKIFNEGIKHCETKGMLNKWINSLYFKNPRANNIRIYGEKAYIFCNDRLVTVIPVPNDMKKDLKKMIMKR